MPPQRSSPMSRPRCRCFMQVRGRAGLKGWQLRAASAPCRPHRSCCPMWQGVRGTVRHHGVSRERQAEAGRGQPSCGYRPLLRNGSKHLVGCRALRPYHAASAGEHLAPMHAQERLGSVPQLCLRLLFTKSRLGPDRTEAAAAAGQGPEAGAGKGPAAGAGGHCSRAG